MRIVIFSFSVSKTILRLWISTNYIFSLFFIFKESLVVEYVLTKILEVLDSIFSTKMMTAKVIMKMSLMFLYYFFLMRSILAV